MNDLLQQEIARQVKWITAFAGPYHTLCGYCAISALRMARILNRKGIRTSVVVNDDHAFNFVYIEGRRLLLDCTANQFREIDDNVEFHLFECPEDSSAKQWFWRVTFEHASPYKAVSEMIAMGWPANQIYQRYGGPKLEEKDF